MITRAHSTKFNTAFLVTLIVVVLCSCAIIGSVLAWLKIDYIRESEGVQIGTVDVGAYHNSTLITDNSPIIISGGNTVRNAGITIKNTGTIDALTRVTIRMYYYESTDAGRDTNPINLMIGNPAENKNYISFDSDGNGSNEGLSNITWLTRFAGNTVVAGDMFCNQRIEPFVINGSEVSINELGLISTFKLSEELKNTDIYIDIKVDSCAYSGNIYKKIYNNETSIDDIPYEAYPFGAYENLPAGWTTWR